MGNWRSNGRWSNGLGEVTTTEWILELTGAAWKGQFLRRSPDDWGPRYFPTTDITEAMQFSSLREIVEGVKDVECVIISGIRTDKNDPDKHYLNVKEIQVL